MSRHDNEYLSEAAYDQYVFAGPASAPELPRQAIEPQRSQHLPWPRNLYGELASIEELMAETANPNDVCACGCRGRHRHNVSQTLWNSSDFDIIWFRSDACKTRWNLTRMRRQANGS
jgi:hypothetical protein